MEAPLGSLPLPMARSSSPSPLWFPALQDEYFYASNSHSPSSSASSLSDHPMLSAASLSAHRHQFHPRRWSSRERIRSPLERSSERIVEQLPSFEQDLALVSSHLGLSRVTSHDTMGTGCCASSFGAATTRTVASADAATASATAGGGGGRRAPRRCSHRAMSAQDFESLLKDVYDGGGGDHGGDFLGTSGKR